MKLIFQATGWNEYHSKDTYHMHHYNIQIFGRTYNDKDVCIKVTGFKPYFYVEIPKNWGKTEVDMFIAALKRKASNMANNGDRGYDASNEFYKHSVVKRQTFDGFEHNNQRMFILLQFDSRHAMWLYAGALAGPIEANGKKETYARYENNIEPILRFIHIRSLQPSGWIEIDTDGAKPLPGYSICDYNYEIDFRSVHFKDMDTLIAPIKIMSYDIECVSCDHDFPRAARITDRIIQIGFTIHRYGLYDCQESYILTRKKCPSIPGVKVLCYKTERGLIKDFTRIVRETKPDIRTGYYISGFDDEYIWDRALKLDEDKARRKGIRYQQLPNKIRDHLLKYYGKLNQDYFAKYEGVTDYFTSFEIKKLASSAMGENVLKLFAAPGIINIDMIKVIQRSYNLSSFSLDNTSAEFIKEKVLDYETNGEKTIIKTRSTKALDPDSYVQIIIKDGYDESPLIADHKYYVSKVEANEFEIELPHKASKKLAKAIANKKEVTWSFAKDDMPYSQLAKYYHEGNPLKIQQIARYCIKDCKLVGMLMDSLEIVVDGISMSNVTYVPMQYLYSRGQGIKIFSLMSKDTLRQGKVIPLMADKNATTESAYYEGAIVLDPKPGIYSAPVTTLDFNAMYPRCSQQGNLSPDTLVKDKKFDNLEGYLYQTVRIKLRDPETKEYLYNADGTHMTISYKFAQKIVTKKDIEVDLKHIIDLWETRIESAENREFVIEDDLVYIQSDVGKVLRPKQRERLITRLHEAYEKDMEKNKALIYNVIDGKYVKYGTLPGILTRLLNERAAVKIKMAKETDPQRKRVLSRIEIALKITANSAYGLMGFAKSAIYCKAVAESITSMARDLLNQAASIVKDNFENSAIVYGDTDSIFIDFGLKDEAGNLRNDKGTLIESIELGKKAAALINSKIPKPSNIVYEKVFWPFIIVSKKRYAGHLYEHDPDKYAVKVMGLMLKRRDNAPIAKIAVGTVFNNVMQNNSIESTFDKLGCVLNRMISNGYALPKFVITKTLRAHYENPGSVAHKVLADRMAARDPGSAPKPNDRIPYLYVVRDLSRVRTDRKMLQGDFVEAPDFAIKHNLRVDHLKYITNQIIEPVSQLLGLAVTQKTLDNFFDSFTKPLEARQKGFRSLCNWTEHTHVSRKFVIEYINEAPKMSTKSKTLFDIPGMNPTGITRAVKQVKKTKKKRIVVKSKSLTEWK